MIKLSKQQVKRIYKEHMSKDFPDNERKPLSVILKGMDKGKYECLGMEKDGEIVGYAIFVKTGKEYLFDYLAVIDGQRSKGIGADFLRQIAEYYEDAGSIIGEVEDPEYAENEKDRSLQTRRLQFYLRNGYRDTGIRVELFGVDYVVLEVDMGKNHTENQIRELYRLHYSTMLPKLIYRKMVKIKN